MEIDSAPSRKISTAQRNASKAESEAAKRIEAARKRVREAEIEAQQQIENQRDSYEKRSEMERSRQEGHLEKQKFEGYERIRETQRMQETEEQRLKRQADKELSDLKKYYGTALVTTESEGERKYKDAVSQNFKQEETLRRQNLDQVESFKRDQELQMARLRDDREQTVGQMMSHSEVERAKLQQQTRDAIASSKDHYEDIYATAMKRQQTALGTLGSQANRELAELRESTAHRLNAYSSRQSDPFYKMVNLDAEVREADDAFILRAKIPEHEQSQIQVNIRGNEIVISGQRRNEEKLDLEPGRTQRTSSYQSFSETFPIHWPVEPKGMIREFTGETLIVRIPKKQTYAAEQFKAKRTAEKAHVEKPQFPKNLPGETELNEKLAQVREAEVVTPEKKSRSSRTLG